MSRSPLLLVYILGLVLLSVPAHARPTVLFDQGHGQRFLIDKGDDLDLSRLAGVFRDAGFEPTSSTSLLTAERLTATDALILSGTFKPYTPEEIAAIAAFVNQGGALCIMLHVAPPLATLLHRLGVAHANGVIREQENIIDDDPLNFRVTRLADHPLFLGIRQFSLHGVWALLDERSGVQAIAHTSPSAWIDLNGNRRLDQGDARQSFAVAVAGQAGKGRFVVFGDDAVFQNKFLVGDNLTLGRNLAAWLATGTARQ